MQNGFRFCPEASMKGKRGYQTLIAVSTVLAAAALVFAQPPRAADAIITHGKVYTLDVQHPWAQAVAMADGKIVSVGEDAQIEKLRGPGTQGIDAAGRPLL